MIQRTGEVVIRLLDNVQQATIKPLILQTIMPGTQIYTDEYGDGFCEVHSNTMEGFWSLLRSWLRPHRGDIAVQAAVVPELF